MPPSVSRQLPPKQATTVNHAPDLSGILSGGVSAADLGSSKLNTAIYGRNGVGKTTFACQGDGRIALIAIDPSPTGGARSVGRSNVIVYYVASHNLKDSTGRVEQFRGSEKVMAVVDAIGNALAKDKNAFSKVVVDGLNSWFEVILGEILAVDFNNMPAVLSKGKVSTDQYVERTERLIRYLRPIMNLQCDVTLIAQEKDHNPPKNDKGVVVGSKLIREAMVSAQEGSFYSLAISDEATRCVQNACDFVMQLYEDNEFREEKLPDVVINGQTVPGQVQLIPTGRRVKRLRCTYHPNYAARFRSPNYENVPEYIEAPDPHTRYQAFLDVVGGKRTKFGYYKQ